MARRQFAWYILTGLPIVTDDLRCLEKIEKAIDFESFLPLSGVGMT